jgi:hypothetical protein
MMALAQLIMAMNLIGKPLDETIIIQITLLAGALAGFLLLNLGLWPGRKVFLGDAGHRHIAIDFHAATPRPFAAFARPHAFASLLAG